MNKEIQEQILELTKHNIPFYAYGDNEAACELSRRLNEVASIVSQVEPEVKPACETDKTQCKFCTRETTAEDFGFGKDRVCKSCLEKALANLSRSMLSPKLNQKAPT